MNAIFEAIASRDEVSLRKILRTDPGAAHAVNADGISALMWALYHHEPAFAELIAGQGIELTIWEAAASGDLRTVQRLLELQPDVALAYGPDGFTAMHLAAFFGRADVVRALLAHGADANSVAQNQSRVTPLHSAVAGRHLDCVTDLLAAGARPNVTQAGGFTPLHNAAEHGDRQIYDALVAAGAQHG